MGAIQFEGVHFKAAIERPATGVVVARMSGWDAGELGDGLLRELAKDVAKPNSLSLFIDARSVRGASIEVSGEWAHWLGKHRDAFRQISMLTGSRYVHVSATFVQRYAGLADLMRIYTDAGAFDEALAEAVAAA